MLVELKNEMMKLIPDSLYLQLLFRKRMGYPLNLRDPKSFNEKLQWLKLNDRKPIYTIMVDKFAVKDYVASIIGEQYIIPTFGVWNCFDDINFETLPDQFVLKCTHDSGGLVIVTDKCKMDKRAARQIIEKSLAQNFYWIGREWPYKNVKPLIIAEKYMEDHATSQLMDYKVFCFDGEPKLIQVDYDRFKDHKRNLYTVDWNYVDASIEYPTDPNHQISRPDALDEMLKVAGDLSKGIPHVRVDLYNVQGRIYFGELTFYHGSGMEKFTPKSLEMEMGSWLRLPPKTVYL